MKCDRCNWDLNAADQDDDETTCRSCRIAFGILDKPRRLLNIATDPMRAHVQDQPITCCACGRPLRGLWADPQAIEAYRLARWQRGVVCSGCAA